jgi:hypothetical protein
VNLSLKGTVSNRAAIGARIKVTFKDSDTIRSVYRDVNSGGSFGSNPLKQHIGIGRARSIERIEITWPVTGKLQVFEDPPIDTNIGIKEGDSRFSTYQLNRLDFVNQKHGLLPRSPK